MYNYIITINNILYFQNQILFYFKQDFKIKFYKVKV